ncbi:MAG: hypothetical protein LBF87_03495 [Treponema sp.]|nr:hypothetical protein [Treponema sp.]
MRYSSPRDAVLLMRYTLSLGFEQHIETMFKLLNDQAIQSRLISMRLSCIQGFNIVDNFKICAKI